MPKRLPARKRQDSENLYELVEVLDVLRLGLDEYKTGRKSAWSIVSAYLHLLLTDQSKGGDPLAVRVLSSLKLHPMLIDISKGSYLMHAPVGIFGNQAGVFDWGKPRIPLTNWLDQIAYVQPVKDRGVPIKIGDLIREPRHQAGGVHFDQEISEMMALIEGILAFVHIGDEQMSYRDYIVAIGEYVVSSQRLGENSSSRAKRDGLVNGQ